MTSPDTIGPQHSAAARNKDPRGQLVFSWLPKDLQSQEDSRAKADFDYRPVKPRGFSRPATSVEKELLEHLGHVLPAELMTEVTFTTRGVRTRRWPALETQEMTS